MSKSAWFMTMSVFFLAAALLWAVPVSGQYKEVLGQSKDGLSQSKDAGRLPKSSYQISVTDSTNSSGHYGSVKKPKTSLDNRLDLSTQSQGKNKVPAKSGLTLTPTSLDTQPKSQTPGDNKTPSNSSVTLTPTNTNTQPQSLTPGGTKIP